MHSVSAHMCFLWSAAALTLPPSQRVVYIRLDYVCCIKHPLQVKVWDHMLLKPVHITIMHPLGRKHWPGLEEKGFLHSFPLQLWACFQQLWAVTPKGGRVGTVLRQSDGKTDIYALISTGGLVETQLFCLKMKRWAEALEGLKECRNLKPQIWTECCITLN